MKKAQSLYTKRVGCIVFMSNLLRVNSPQNTFYIIIIYFFFKKQRKEIIFNF
jgi:hypothetical protein